jgi:hypothetical protein
VETLFFYQFAGGSRPRTHAGMLVAVSKPCGKKKHKNNRKQQMSDHHFVQSGPGYLACMQAVQQQQQGPSPLAREREREREREKADSSVEALKSYSKQSITHHRAKIDHATGTQQGRNLSVSTSQAANTRRRRRHRGETRIPCLVAVRRREQ